MKKAFIFDWTGTLSDNFHCFKKVCDSIFQEFGKEIISDEEVRMNFTTPYMNFWNKYIPDISKSEMEVLYEKHTKEAGEPNLFDGVKETITHLKESGFEMFVVSLDPKSKLTIETERSGISHFMTEIIGGVDHKKEDSINYLIEKYDLDRNNTYFIGDTTGDIVSGEIANIKTIAITWGIQHEKTLSKAGADYLINNIKEIKNIIN
ncbi:MAG: HAD family hydrolase [Candidatus Pacebacteria bacterium]|nr:HAD family hydrolase [Candidatus Paceibacterota bacterium]